MKGSSIPQARAVADSTADVPIPLVEELDVVVAPCFERSAQETRLASDDITRGQFHVRLPSGTALAATLLPVGMSAEVCKRPVEQAEQVICVHPAAKHGREWHSGMPTLPRLHRGG